MGMVVQHNLNAMSAYNKLNSNVTGLKKSSEKLSSGYRINRAGDDAAGLAISEKMRSQIRGLNQAVRNSQDGINMIQTYEGAANETHSILQRMKELASESANGTYDNATDRAAIQLEFDQLNDELNQIADTDFNGTMALNGGQMADGTKVDGNGIVNYTTATREAQQLGTTGGFVKGISTDGLSNTVKEETVTFTAAKDGNGNITWEVSDGALNGAAGSETSGGFSYAGVKVHVDTTKVVAGDTITLKLSQAQAAVGITGAVVGTTTDVKGTSTKTGSSLAIKPTNANITSQELADAINGLNGLTIKETTNAAGAAISTTTFNGYSVPTTAGAKQELYKVGESGSVYLKEGSANKIYYIDGKGGSEVELAEWTTGTLAAGTPAGATTFTTKVGVSQASYTPASSKGVELVEPNSKVSVSNSYDKSTAIMTYTDNITLQTGARTKDSVNFTFNYNTDKTADMGDLKANLNLSARADGLNTENLSLATQEDANYAIDQIDKAINKTSMVRASFGSIQNRLEHKIDNLTTTSTNLQEAESAIRDTDMASEMMTYTKYNILQQAAQSMLAQANQQPQSVLQLLG